MGKRRQVTPWLSDWLAENRRPRCGGMVLRAPVIVCGRGLQMSVQANRFCYCIPQRDTGPYRWVEVGFPNRKIREFLRYAEDRKNPKGTVYGYVPVRVVEKVINRYGGVQGVAHA